METIDSVIFAAFVGGAIGFFLNSVWKFADSETDAILAGAALGATVQIVVRVTGVS